MRRALLLVLPCLLLAGCGQDDPYADQRAQLAYQESVANTARMAIVWNVLAGALILAVLIGLSYLAARLYLEARGEHRRQEIVIINASGQAMPYPYRLAVSAPQTIIDVTAGAQRVALAAALHQPGQAPHTFSYHHEGAPALPGPEPAAGPAAPAPTFAALLAAGIIAPTAPLVLGYTPAGALTGGWRDLYSSAVAGLSGSGKTTTLRFLAGQSALHGARFLVLDPHADAGEESLAGTLAPLAPVFLAPPAADDRAMLHALGDVQTELQRRLRGAPATPPIIVAIDEFTSLMARSTLAEPLAGLIEAVAQEGRKVGVFALISGQIWTAARTGSSALRDALASVYVHRSHRQQARLLLPVIDAPRAERLPAGTALLMRTSGEVSEVTIPLTTAADMAAVGARLVTSTARALPPPAPLALPEPPEWPALAELIRAAGEAPPAAGKGREAPEAARVAAEIAPVAGTATGAPAAPSAAAAASSPEVPPRQARVRARLKEGATLTEIIRQEWGVSGGRAYQQAAGELRDLIAGML